MLTLTSGTQLLTDGYGSRPLDLDHRRTADGAYTPEFPGPVAFEAPRALRTGSQ